LEQNKSPRYGGEGEEFSLDKPPLLVGSHCFFFFF